MSAIGLDHYSCIATSGSTCALMILVNALLIICGIVKGHLAASAISTVSSILYINTSNGSKGSNGWLRSFSAYSSLLGVTSPNLSYKYSMMDWIEMLLKPV